MDEELQQRTSPTTAFDLTVAEVLEASPGPFFALSRDWRFLYLNAAAEPLLGRPAADLLDKVVWDEFAEAVDSPFFAEYSRAMRDEVTVNFTAFYPPLERWFAVQAVPQRLGLSVFFHDVTSLKQAEEHSARSVSTHASLRTVATAVAAEADPEMVFERSAALYRLLVATCHRLMLSAR
jgi:PAS domain S-box-containing protein